MFFSRKIAPVRTWLAACREGPHQAQPRGLPAQPTIEYRVGMRVPQTAQIDTVPETVAIEVPAIKTYIFMMVNNRVVLIDPATSEVVDEFADEGSLC